MALQAENARLTAPTARPEKKYVLHVTTIPSKAFKRSSS
jgi:hypothetical protein